MIQKLYVINFLTLVAKQLIYRARFMNTRIDIESIIMEIEMIQKVEEFNTARDNKLYKYKANNW